MPFKPKITNSRNDPKNQCLSEKMSDNRRRKIYQVVSARGKSVAYGNCLATNEFIELLNTDLKNFDADDIKIKCKSIGYSNREGEAGTRCECFIFAKIDVDQLPK